MKANDRMLRRYFRRLRKLLPCDRQKKRMILCEVRGSIYSYLDKNPDADLAAIEARFGRPESIAASYLYNEELAQLLLKYRIRRKLLAIVAATAAAMVLIWSIGVAWIAHYEMSQHPYYAEVRILDNGEGVNPPWYHE